MIALQLIGLVLLSVAIVAFLERILGPAKKGRELMRFTGNVDAEARFDTVAQTAWNQAAERCWRRRYERLSIEQQLGESCDPARDQEVGHE